MLTMFSAVPTPASPPIPTVPTRAQIINNSNYKILILISIQNNLIQIFKVFKIIQVLAIKMEPFDIILVRLRKAVASPTRL